MGLLAALLATLAAALFAPARAAPVMQSSDYAVDLLATGLGAATGMGLTTEGDLLITDDAGFRVLRIRAPGSPGAHPVELVTSSIPFPNDVTTAFGGKVLVTSPTGPASNIVEVRADGTLQPFAANFSFPIGIATFGNYVYVACSGDGTIKRVDAGGASSVFLSGFSGPGGPFGMAFDVLGNLYFVVHETGQVYKASDAGETQQLGAVSPLGGVFVAATRDGTLFVSDVIQGSLYLLDRAGAHPFATGFAGKTNPPFNGPNDVVIDGVGRIYVADAGNVWRLTPAFPQTQVLDAFGRANGSLGSNWKGDTDIGSYAVNDSQMLVRDGGPALWKPSSFGINQEVFATFAGIQASSTKQSLLLKQQGSGEGGVVAGIEVVYDALNEKVGVLTRRPGQGSSTTYATFPLKLIPGDQLGARASANGEVRIYRNHLTVGVVTLDQYDQLFFAGKGGRIGVWFESANQSRLDDFGGGSVR